MAIYLERIISPVAKLQQSVEMPQSSEESVLNAYY